MIWTDELFAEYRYSRDNLSKLWGKCFSGVITHNNIESNLVGLQTEYVNWVCDRIQSHNRKTKCNILIKSVYKLFLYLFAFYENYFMTFSYRIKNIVNGKECD